MAKLDWNLRQNENGQTCVQIMDGTGCFSFFIPFDLYESIYTQSIEILSKQTCAGCSKDVVEKS